MTGRHADPALLAALVVLGSTLGPASVCAQEREPEPVLSSPTARESEEEPSIEELEASMVPTLVLPEFRVRLSGGVGIQTAGASAIYGRITEEVEWQPPALQFVLLGIGGAQLIGPGGVIYQVGGRVGGHAWFCEDAVVRCQGAITLQLGYVGGAGGAGFDFSADADLRFLFVKTVEVFVRGGFFAVGMASFVNVTAGLAIAF
ncbi:MAG: hypothetical protein M3Y87_17875 [Myxococcota bacterium]|nr:hypothetical protein [Myxococcota bacterium]